MAPVPRCAALATRCSVARINAAEFYALSVPQKVDVADIYAKALRTLPETMDGQPPLPVPGVCPVTLDELMGDQQ